MSRSGRLRGPSVLLALAALASPAPAQESPEPGPRADAVAERDREEAALEARAAVLVARRAVLEPRARVADSIRDARRVTVPAVPLDTLAFGGLRVVTPADQRDRTEALWREAWRPYRPMVPGRSALDGHVVGFQWGTRHELGLAPGHHSLRVGSAWLPVRRARAAAEGVLGGLLVDDVPEGVAAWSERAPLRPPDWEAVYRELAVSDLDVVGRCFGGDVAACWTAVGGVGDGGRAALVTALRGVEARALVDRRATPVELPWRACLEGGDDDACRRVLLEDATFLELVPASAEARASLLWVALQAGGEGALERLRAAAVAGDASSGERASSAPFDVRATLAVVAGADADEVVARWIERVLASRPEPHADLDGGRTLVALWTVVFAFLATRSTRWRFG